MITFDNELYSTNTLRTEGKKSCDVRIRIKDWKRVWRQGGQREGSGGPADRTVFSYLWPEVSGPRFLPLESKHTN